MTSALWRVQRMVRRHRIFHGPVPFVSDPINARRHMRASTSMLALWCGRRLVVHTVAHDQKCATIAAKTVLHPATQLHSLGASSGPPASCTPVASTNSSCQLLRRQRPPYTELQSHCPLVHEILATHIRWQRIIAKQLLNTQRHFTFIRKLLQNKVFHARSRTRPPSAVYENSG